MTILLGKINDYNEGIKLIEELIISMNLEGSTIISIGGFFLAADTVDELEYSRNISYLQDVLATNSCHLICIEEVGSDQDYFRNNNYKSIKSNIHVQSNCWYHKESKTMFMTMAQETPFVIDMDTEEYDAFIDKYYIYLDHMIEYRRKCPVDNLITNVVDSDFYNEYYEDKDTSSFIDYHLSPLTDALTEFFKEVSVKHVLLPSNKDSLYTFYKKRKYTSIFQHQARLLCL